MTPYILLVAPTSLSVESYCMVSEHQSSHNSYCLCFSEKAAWDNINVTHPSLATVHYFSDGCAGQYKNRYNIINLCHHKGLLAEWHHHMVKLHVMGLVEQQNALPLMLVFSDPLQTKSLLLKTCLHFAGTTYMYMVCIFTL